MISNADCVAPSALPTTARTPQPGGNRKIISSVRSATLTRFLSAERMVRAAHKNNRLTPQLVQNDPARRFVGCDAVARTGAQGDAHGAVTDRLQVAYGAGRRLAQLDDDAGVPVPEAREDPRKVNRPGVQGGCQRDCAAYQARERR